MKLPVAPLAPDSLIGLLVGVGDAHKSHTVRVLEIHTESADPGLADEDAIPALSKPQHGVFAVIFAVGSANLHRIGYRLMQRVRFIVQFTPYEELIPRHVHTLCASTYPIRKRPAAGCAALLECAGLHSEQKPLGGAGFENVLIDDQLWQLETFIGISKVRRLSHEYRPRCEPAPELLFGMALESPLGGLAAVMDKERGQHLSHRHDTQELCVVSEIGVIVRAGSGCTGQTIRDIARKFRYGFAG